MRKNLFLLWLGFALAPSANAYVDPSSSLLIIQGLLALIGGVIAFVRRPLEKLRAAWRWVLRKRDA